MTKLALLAVACAAAAGSSPQPVARVQTGDAPAGLTAAYGVVWVPNDESGTLARVDPRTNRVTRRLRLQPGLFSVAHGFGALWVVNYREGSLTRVDPTTLRKRTVRVGAVPFDVLAAYGRVWVTAWEVGRLVEVDPRSLKILRRTRIGPRPAGLRAAGGAVWVGFGRSATAIARIDPRTHRIEPVRSAFARRRVFPSARATSGSRRATTCSSGSTPARGRCEPGSRSAAHSHTERWPPTERSGCRTRS